MSGSRFCEVVILSFVMIWIFLQIPFTASMSISRVSGVQNITQSTAVQPGFSLVPAVSGLSIEQGFSANTTVSILGDGSFSGDVQLNVTISPPGPFSLINPPTAVLLPTGGQDGRSLSLVVVYTYPDSAVGNHVLTVTGTSGSISSTTTLTIVVTSPSTIPDFSIVARPPELYAISGLPATSNITLVNPNGVARDVNLSAAVFGGYPGGPRANVSSSQVHLAGGDAVNLTITFVTPALSLGVFIVTITGVSGDIVHDVSIFVFVRSPTPAQVGFSIRASGGHLLIVQGSRTETGISLSRIGQPIGDITVTMYPNVYSPLPNTIVPNMPIASLNPPIVTFSSRGNSTLEVFASSYTPIGDYTVIISAFRGPFATTTALSVTVIREPATVIGPAGETVIAETTAGIGSLLGLAWLGGLLRRGRGNLPDRASDSR